MKGRYYISRISAINEDGTSSCVDLTSGMNVIYGPSNTGKSYVLSCIRYVLGKNSPPIAEELGYDEFSVLFRNTENDTYLEITREPGSKCSIESNIPGISSGKYNSNECQSIILSLMEITGKHSIYSTQTRDKQTVTFNSFAPFFMVDEERIVSSDSILLSPGFKNITPKISLLNFLLYGIDANSDTSTENIETRRLKRAAVKSYIRKKIAMLAKEKEKLEADLIEYNIDQDAESILESYDKELKETEQLINSVKTENQETLKLIAELEERHQIALVTLDRYRNLESQYESDLKRLEFIINGNEVKDLFTEPTRCPFCDNELNNQKQETEYVQSARDEYIRTEKLLADLRTAYKTVEDEDAALSLDLTEKKHLADSLLEQIQQVLVPRVNELRNVLGLYKRNTEIKKQLELLDSAASEYNSEIEEQEKEEDKEQEYDPRQPLIEGDFFVAFEKELKGALEKSNFPGLLTCNMDPMKMDVVVNQKRKTNQGKGYRAYLNSVYSSTLFRYVIEHGKYAPFTLILDSPVLSLKEGIAASELVESPMRKGLFNYLKECSSYGQVIIIENDIPEIDYAGVNLIEFTKKEKQGRYGFLLGVIEE